jgi:hypothetical protein
VLELITRFARVFWRVLDCVDYAVTYVKCWAVDVIYGPEPPTAADKQREAEREKLRETFPMIGLDRTIAVTGELQKHVVAKSIGPAQVSNPTEPRPEVPADPPTD